MRQSLCQVMDSVESARLSQLMISATTKTNPLLSRWLDVLQISSALSARNIESQSCTIIVCDCRPENRDNGGEKHSILHDKRLPIGFNPSIKQPLPYQCRNSLKRHEIVESLSCKYTQSLGHLQTAWQYHLLFLIL